MVRNKFLNFSVFKFTIKKKLVLKVSHSKMSIKFLLANRNRNQEFPENLHKRDKIPQQKMK